MSVLSKKEVEAVRETQRIVMRVHGYTDVSKMNLIDTIADRDKQIFDLRAKVRELENRPYRPQPVIAEEPEAKYDCEECGGRGFKQLHWSGNPYSCPACEGEPK